MNGIKIFFIDFTLSSLLRCTGKNAALVLVYMFIVFLLASVMFFTDAVRRAAARPERRVPIEPPLVLYLVAQLRKQPRQGVV